MNRTSHALGRSWPAALVAGLAVAFASHAAADVIHVPGDAPTIQQAVDLASPGDEIVVAPGAYAGVTEIKGKPLTIRSEAGPEFTTLSHTQQGISRTMACIDIVEGTMTIDGFTFDGKGQTGQRAIVSVNSNTHITNCRFVDHHAGSNNSAGAVAGSSGGTLTIVDCEFESNSAKAFGGAVYGWGLSTHIENCTFHANSAGYGGAVSLRGPGDISVMNCAFTSNVATLNGDSAVGGAMSLYIESSPQNTTTALVDSCMFDGNANAPNGLSGAGAMVIDTSQDFTGRSTATVRSCTFTGHEAAVGSAIILGGKSDPEELEVSDLAVEDCIFNNNGHPDGASAVIAVLHGRLTVTLTAVAIVENQARGVSWGATEHAALHVVDSVFRDNVTTAPVSAIDLQAWSDDVGPPVWLTVTGSTFEGNDAATGGAVIRSEWPVVTTIARSHFCENEPQTIDGNWTDAGGNTFADTCSIPGDLDGDGTVDGADLAILLGAWAPCADCDDCDADLDENCEVDGADLAMLLGNWG